jgi:hypothetical protein
MYYRSPVQIVGLQNVGERPLQKSAAFGIVDAGRVRPAQEQYPRFADRPANALASASRVNSAACCKSAGAIGLVVIRVVNCWIRGGLAMIIWLQISRKRVTQLCQGGSHSVNRRQIAANWHSCVSSRQPYQPSITCRAAEAVVSCASSSKRRASRDVVHDPQAVLQRRKCAEIGLNRRAG